MSQKVAVFWFRRDLRLADNAGLYHALKSEYPVLPLFIFDREILDKLEDKDDARVSFLHRVVTDLAQDVRKKFSAPFEVQYGTPVSVWQSLVETYNIAAVYTNRDYEPYAKERDAAVRKVLAEAGIELYDFKDQVVFEKDEVLTQAGGYYTVFTPYSRSWRAKLEERMDEDENGNSISYYLKAYPSLDLGKAFAKTKDFPEGNIPSLEEMGFEQSDLDIPTKEIDDEIIRCYDEKRDFPAVEGTSRLGIHLRFGTIGVRGLIRHTKELNKTYVTELIWRDFYSQVLQANPEVVKQSFRPEYDEIEWLNDEEHFKAWCAGRTGYPLVDAGMRQLNQTGYMHNRVRMVVASFLTKHLLTHWSWGEAYFARKLLDFDLASNNGGWQWAAGSGTDAAPYFRVFNPESQLKKFDKSHEYVKTWVPEFGTEDYPEPIVVHKNARQRAIDTYKAGLAEARGD